ncbi:MAG: hypothetical protein ACI9V0_003521 [Parasphingorhabdus sp.]|jgi:hypothetical protein
MTSRDQPPSGKHPFFDIDPDRGPRLPFPDSFEAGMGTELVAPFLYSLVRMLRPTRLLEIGCGYTTPWLIKALEDNEDVHIDWNADPEYFQKAYDPVLICIDNDDAASEKSGGGSNDMLQSDYVRFFPAKFEGLSAEIKDEYGELDFVWFDCGGPEEYRHFCEEYLPICSGYIFFHFTYYHGQPNSNHDIISEFISADKYLGEDGKNLWSQIDLVEPHKYRQGSVTMLKHKDFRKYSPQENGESD